MLSPFRLSVCLSVTLVRSTQPVEIFGNFSSAFGTLAIHWHPRKNLRRSFQGNPPSGGFNARGVAKYSDFWHLECYNFETVQDCNFIQKKVFHRRPGNGIDQLPVTWYFWICRIHWICHRLCALRIWRPLNETSRAIETGLTKIHNYTTSQIRGDWGAVWWLFDALIDTTSGDNGGNGL